MLTGDRDTIIRTNRMHSSKPIAADANRSGADRAGILRESYSYVAVVAHDD
jgi:hypothetical protein